MSVQADPQVDARTTGRTGAENAPESRAVSTQASPAAPQEQTERGPDYFRQAFQRVRAYQQPAAPAPQAPDPAPVSPPESAPAPSDSEVHADERSGAAAEPSTTLPPRRKVRRDATAPPSTSQETPSVYTEEQINRMIQSRVDQEIARRQQSEAARFAQERELELRRTDPVGYVNLLEEREREQAENQEQVKRLTQTLEQQLFQYDRNILDIFVGALPEDTRAKVIAKEEGIPGRKATAAQTLRALKSVYVAEGRASARQELMKDQAFIKEILARFGGQSPEPESPPVAIRPPARSAQTVQDEHNASVNTWMRVAAQGARQTSGR